MFQGFTDKTIDFMWNIRFNNEKSWFDAHKDEYKTMLEKPMHELAQDLYSGFSASQDDLNLRLHISRIYRDARRLHGNGPYKDHLWFTLRQYGEEWTDKPVFWFELAPENWSYGLGYYGAKALTMAKLRARIDSNPKSLTKLSRELDRQTEFTLDGDNYVRPKCDPGTPLSDWYNKKTFSLIHEEKISQAVFSPDLAKRIKQGFEFLIPYYQYFVTLDGDCDPRDHG
jgi:uncharacterized protein (TIGR02453 family)